MQKINNAINQNQLYIRESLSKDISNSFVVVDDIEVGSGNKIPMWLFGFLY
jgi:hypothetical protein